MGLRERTAKARHGLGRLRPLLGAWQLLQRRRLVPAKRRYRELGLRKPWFGSIHHAEVAGRGRGVATLDRPGGIDEIASDERFAALDPKLREGLREWPQRGYLVAEGFFDRDSVATLNARDRSPRRCRHDPRTPS